MGTGYPQGPETCQPPVCYPRLTRLRDAGFLVVFAVSPACSAARSPGPSAAHYEVCVQFRQLAPIYLGKLQTSCWLAAGQLGIEVICALAVLVCRAAFLATVLPSAQQTPA